MSSNGVYNGSSSLGCSPSFQQLHTKNASFENFTVSRNFRNSGLLRYQENIRWYTQLQGQHLNILRVLAETPLTLRTWVAISILFDRCRSLQKVKWQQKNPPICKVFEHPIFKDLHFSPIFFVKKSEFWRFVPLSKLTLNWNLSFVAGFSQKASFSCSFLAFLKLGQGVVWHVKQLPKQLPVHQAKSLAARLKNLKNLGLKKHSGNFHTLNVTRLCFHRISSQQ